MCGIAGIVSFDVRRPVEHRLVAAMTAALAHRGPDGDGFFVAGPAGLGFRRLAIVDPRPEGNQPHYDEDGGIVSVCNGEIYNHRELRHDLEARQHRFRSRCDVEVLPHLYQQWGNGLMSQLNGQFAFAVYDRSLHRVLLARDPVGVCPLFYTEVDGQLLFASEIKALLTHPAVTRRVDLAGLDQIVTFPGLVSPTTMFAGIRSLPAGHALALENGRLREWTYWDLDYPIDHREPSADWQEQLDHLLGQAVGRRLQADVPVGFYLSGGLDSSLVAGLIHRLRPAETWNSFSILFEDDAIDERTYQRMVASRIGSRHHEIRFGIDEVEKRLRGVIRHTETPVKETYDSCSHALSDAVRAAGCKVVLSGEGADELFAGYVGYRMDMVRDGAGPDGGLFDEDAWAEAQLRERLWGDPEFVYERDYAALGETKAALYSPDLAATLPSFDATARPPVDHGRLKGRHAFHRRSYLDFKLRIADHLLSDHGDRMTFAHGVEGRYPFLDQDLIRFVTTLPPDLLIRDGQEKFPLRAVARRYVPPAIAGREKFAFVAPGAPALLRRERDWIGDLLAPERIRRDGYFNPVTIAALRDAHVRDGQNVNQTFEIDLLMIVVTFQIFLEEFGLRAWSG